MINNDLITQLEPSDDQRGAARSLYGLFTALLDEGFDEDQAVQIVSAALGAVINDK